MWSIPSLRSPQRALLTETKVESGTSQTKGGTSVNLSTSGKETVTSALLGASSLPRDASLTHSQSWKSPEKPVSRSGVRNCVAQI